MLFDTVLESLRLDLCTICLASEVVLTFTLDDTSIPAYQMTRSYWWSFSGWHSSSHMYAAASPAYEDAVQYANSCAQVMHYEHKPDGCLDAEQ
jgi:hypothetical protein